MHLLGQVLEAPRLTVLVHDLLPQHVDLLLVLLVLGLGLIQAELLILARVLLPIEADVVTLVVDGLGSDLVDVIFLFAELVLHLLDLVLEDLELSLLILKLLRVDVDLPLKSSCLTLVYRVVPAAHGATCNR